ncbi:MAG TPA: hypothetical protein PKW80_13605 [Bacteroidales bacterium]|nr:hypothetical protein [Bacteroidales bacterium]
MKDNLIQKLMESRIRQTIILLAAGIALVLFSALVGKFGATMNVIAFFTGSVLLFYGMLRYWEKALLYIIMCVVFIVLIILEFQVGIDILVKKFKGTHEAEDIAWTIGGVFFAGVLAGIIGFFSFIRKRE